MSAAMPSPSSNITRRRGKTLRDLERIKASQQRQQRRQTEKTNLLSFVAVRLKYLKQRDVSIIKVSMYKHIVALMDDEDKVGVSPNRSIPTSIYTRSGGSVISTLSEVDYTGGTVDSDEKVGYQPGSTISS